MRWILFLLISVPVLAQTRAQIDSLNKLRYDVKINQASVLGKKYVTYANAAQKMGYREGQADALANAALLFYYRGKHEEGVRYRQQAIAIYESLDNREKLAHELAEMGFSMKRRNMQQAQNYMQRGMRMAQSGKYNYRLAGIYDNYGVLKEMQNQLDSAFLFYNKSLDLKYKLADSVGIPYSLSNIAGIYVMRKQFEQAVPYYQKAIAIRQARKDKIGLTETYGNMAWMYRESGQNEKAIELYNKGIDLALESGYIHMATLFLNDLSRLYESRGQVNEALKTARLYSVYKDSVINKETNTKLAELETEFDIARKEKLLLERDAQVRERNTLLVGVSVLAVFIALVGYLIFRQQRLKNRQMSQEHELKSAIVQIENQNKLQEQRLAISRDLHDNIGSQLTFIISSVENIKFGFAIQNTKLEEKLNNISSFARDTIVELRDTIWAMNDQAITVEDLRARIMNFMEKARVSHPNVNLAVNISPDLDALTLSSVEGMNIYRTLQEAVNNALKYSGATQIDIQAGADADAINLVIRDN
ncbi:MAG TPA: tetratricopeptide repeat protein, partial [Flavobacterium sp.]|nr:tetratricopeptide repeat protein [Flavobacterium sp.]